jgi:hypothetical protein
VCQEVTLILCTPKATTPVPDKQGVLDTESTNEILTSSDTTEAKNNDYLVETNGIET